jgi:transcriptional regulator with XRE-family HTH domain
VAKQSRRTYHNDEEGLKKMGAKIREVRIAAKLSQEQLAIACDLDASQIGRMERGIVNFRYATLLRIAKVLNIKTIEL